MYGLQTRASAWTKFLDVVSDVESYSYTSQVLIEETITAFSNFNGFSPACNYHNYFVTLFNSLAFTLKGHV